MSKIENKKKKKILKRTIFFIICDILVLICFFITYGPWDYLRTLYVTTAMKTMNHSYLARIFYSEETIAEIMNSNYFVSINDDVDLDDILGSMFGRGFGFSSSSRKNARSRGDDLLYHLKLSFEEAVFGSASLLKEYTNSEAVTSLPSDHLALSLK